MVLMLVSLCFAFSSFSSSSCSIAADGFSAGRYLGALDSLSSRSWEIFRFRFSVGFLFPVGVAAVLSIFFEFVRSRRRVDRFDSGIACARTREVGFSFVVAKASGELVVVGFICFEKGFFFFFFGIKPLSISVKRNGIHTKVQTGLVSCLVYFQQA